MSDNEPSLAIGAITLDGCDGKSVRRHLCGTGEKQHPSRYLLWHGLADWADFGRRDLTIRLEPGWRRCLQICLDQQCGSGSHYDGQQPRLFYVTLSSGVTASATESTVTAPPPPQGYGITSQPMAESNGTRLACLERPGAKSTDLEMDPTSNTTLYAGFLGLGVFKTNRRRIELVSAQSRNSPASRVALRRPGLPNPLRTRLITCKLPFTGRVRRALQHFTFCRETARAKSSMPAQPPFTSHRRRRHLDSTHGNSQLRRLRGFHYSRYTHALTINPTNPSTLFVGGVYLFQFDRQREHVCDVGTNELHPDHHSVAFADPSNLLRMYDASDGGFAFTADGGNTWTSEIATCSITIQSIASSRADARAFGGTQDNGAELGLARASGTHRMDGDFRFHNPGPRPM